MKAQPAKVRAHIDVYVLVAWGKVATGCHGLIHNTDAGRGRRRRHGHGGGGHAGPVGGGGRATCLGQW